MNPLIKLVQGLFPKLFSAEETPSEQPRLRPQPWVVQVRDMAAELPILQGDFPRVPEQNGENIICFFEIPGYPRAEADWAGAIIVNAAIAAQRWVPVTSGDMMKALGDAIIVIPQHIPGVMNMLRQWVADGLLEYTLEGDAWSVSPTPQLARLLLKSGRIAWDTPKNYR